MYLISFIVLTVLLGCQTKNNRSQPKTELAQINLSQMKRDLVACGESGRLLQRIKDCSEKNPHMSQISIGGNHWQQVSYFEKSDLHFWIDSKQGIVWSSPVDSIQKCAEPMTAIQNAGSALVVSAPTLEQYRIAFQNQFPPLLLSTEARYFTHRDERAAGMTVDEQEKIFTEQPEEEQIWLRCSGE
ncbi:hypothetical protein N9D31_00315 [Oligoflexaceae bacterium]|nr:hypothetical protein [Oligoflexaceae bacterium]